jgi:hypothetical protein
LKAELEEAHGKNVVAVTDGPTEPASLKGVTYAAKKSVVYAVEGVKREQGWIYGFVEPYQVFILYLILEIEGSNDREEIKQFIDSFRFTANPGAN